MKYELDVKFNKDFIVVDEDHRKITMGVKSKPIKGKANQEIIRKLAKHFDVSSANVRIVAGIRSKKKLIEVIE